VNGPTHRIIQLVKGVDVALSDCGFDCGHPDYNQWLEESAFGAVRSGTSAVYFLVDDEVDDDTAARRVLGYFAFCPTTVQREGVPKSEAGGLMRTAPGWLLTKLALDVSLQGDRAPGMGRQLVLAALASIVKAADQGGGQVIVVDADDERLVDFYRGCGFRPTGREGDLRLYMKVSTARKYLAAGPPA
jgi:ribosomal protein S18 acetylase RimI-like enzyme